MKQVNMIADIREIKVVVDVGPNWLSLSTK